MAWTFKAIAAGVLLVAATPMLAQEQATEDNWEGLVRVEDRAGRAVGRGYVEMTGYGEDGRPPV